MKLSHSKLNCILTCPMSYYLKYKQKIRKKEEKPAFWMGSAVHWGIEHNTEDLSEFFNNKSFNTKDNYTKEQILCEAMVHGYLNQKENLFKKILSYNDKNLICLKEEHEVEVSAELKSQAFEQNHNFMGIIDLLLRTEEGFIVIDYKTSTYEPDWDSYLDQIYRYIFLLKQNYPDVPVIKIGIINLRKTAIRQKRNESNDEFNNRMKFEYDVNDGDLINYHEFKAEDLDPTHIKDYIDNLGKMADLAETIDKNNLYYINYAAAKGPYGKSDYYDIFYHTPDAYVLYEIEDSVYDEEKNEMVSVRDCLPIDLLACENKKILNKFEIFQKELLSYEFNDEIPFENAMTEFKKHLSKKYVVDERLLSVYFKTFEKTAL